MLCVSSGHPHSTTSPGQRLRHLTLPHPSLLAASCPAGQVFVNCSELNLDPELSRERTCEQQLLNLSMPARGPCLSGCACPQGYGSTLLETLLPKGWQTQRLQGEGAGMTSHSLGLRRQCGCDACGEPGKKQNLESSAWNGACQVLLSLSHGTLDEEDTCSSDTQCFICKMGT